MPSNFKCIPISIFFKKLFSSYLNFILFLSFSLGIILGYYLFSFILLFLLCLLCLFFIIFFNRKVIISRFLILICFFLLGGLWIKSSSLKIDYFLNKENQFLLEVISLPQKGVLNNIFFAKVKKINGFPVNLKVKVYDYTKQMRYLEIYKVKGKLTEKRYKNKKFYFLWIKSNTEKEKLPSSFLRQIIKKVNEYILNLFKNKLNQQSWRFLSSVFLGRRELLKGEKKVFVKIGIAHLLAISGLHIGIASFFVFFIFRFFRLKYRVCLILSLIFLYFYAFLVGMSFSTLRAVLMYSIFSLGFLLKRKTSLFNSLGLAGLITLLIEPTSIFNLGFQLSYFCVFFIILGFKIFPFKGITFYGLNYLRNIFFASIFATLGVTPLISYHFGKIYLFSIFYNVFLVPLFAFILMVNFVLIIFSPFEFFTLYLGEILNFLIGVFVKLAQFLGSLKFSSLSYRFSFTNIIFYFISLFFFLCFLKRLTAIKESR